MTSRAIPFPRERATDAASPAIRRHLPRVRPLVVFTLAAIIALFAMIYARISLDRNAFELQRLESQIAQEQARYWNLKVEAAELMDPVRITGAAEEMGMVFPERRVPIEVDGITIDTPARAIAPGDATTTVGSP